MASFLDQFAQQMRQVAPQLRDALSGEARNAQERKLKEAVVGHWRPLPAIEPGLYPPTYAVDGSSAVRQLNFGWTVVIAQALVVGPAFEHSLLDHRFVRSAISDDSISRLRSLLMRHLELKAALKAAVAAPSGSCLCLDGSFQTDIPHYLYPLDVPRYLYPADNGDDRHLPLTLLEAYLDLLETCQERGIMLIALSKTSTATFLVEAIRHMPDRDQLEAEVDLSGDDQQQALPSDVEALFRWTSHAGYSTPLLLGVHGFGKRRAELLQRPEATLRRLQGSSAALAFHLRLRAGEEPLRVDVPASLLGLPYRLTDFYLRWGAEADALPALGPILASHGGSTVYNAAAYVADRLVRLTNQMVDGPYLALLRQNLGQYIQYNRSQRRFF